MEEHGISGDKGLYVDKAQEEYVANLGLGEATHDLSRQYSEWSARATVVLASKSDHTLADITKQMGYGQRAVFAEEQDQSPRRNRHVLTSRVGMGGWGTGHY
eukprot:12421097-Karenia_brevis.AAC.1